MTNAAFREYATRVSFNISLSRNQIYCLYCLSNQSTGKTELRRQFGLGNDMFVPGAKWLGVNGLVKYTKFEGGPSDHNFPWELTEAGRHVLGLLKIAGLIPEEIPAEIAA